MTDHVRLIKHEAIQGCGSFEVRYPNDRPSVYFYWDEPQTEPQGDHIHGSQVRRAVERNSAEISAPRQRRDQLGTGLRGVR